MRTTTATLLLIVAMGVASAQQPVAAQSSPGNEAAAKTQRNAERQKDLKAATKGAAEGYTIPAGDAAAKAAARKDEPRVAPDAASKRGAVKSATSGTAKGYTIPAGDAAAAAAKDKSARTPAPKATAGTPEANKVVP